MKVEVTEEEKFEPIEIKLTIESEQELCDLWHRFNAVEGRFNKGGEYVGCGSLKYGACDASSASIYQVLTVEVKKRKL